MKHQQTKARWGLEASTMSRRRRLLAFGGLIYIYSRKLRVSVVIKGRSCSRWACNRTGEFRKLKFSSEDGLAIFLSQRKPTRRRCSSHACGSPHLFAHRLPEYLLAFSFLRIKFWLHFYVRVSENSCIGCKLNFLQTQPRKFYGLLIFNSKCVRNGTFVRTL